MDPTANLEEQLRLASWLADDLREDESGIPDAERLAELVLALHHWIVRSGSLPDQWRRPVDPDEGLLDDPGEQLN